MLAQIFTKLLLETRIRSITKNRVCLDDGDRLFILNRANIKAMKRPKALFEIASSIAIFFVCYSCFCGSVLAESTPDVEESEIKKPPLEETRQNNSLNSQEPLPVEMELEETKIKPFPVGFRESNNLDDFANFQKGDYGQKIILEYRTNF